MRVQVETILEEVENLSEEELNYVIKRIHELLAPEIKRRETSDDNRKENTKRDILEFDGIGAEMWQSVNSDEYLRQLRSEWDQDSSLSKSAEL